MKSSVLRVIPEISTPEYVYQYYEENGYVSDDEKYHEKHHETYHDFEYHDLKYHDCKYYDRHDDDEYHNIYDEDH
ncbi:MAG: hypothetical protein H6546_06970 [Chitinophagales bacterium]|nr:hypothetical protein [Chitinophagales bacterium]